MCVSVCVYACVCAIYRIASSDNNKYGFIKAVRETFVDPLWVDQGALQYPGPATTKYLAVEVATAYLNHTVQNHLRCMRTYFGMKVRSSHQLLGRSVLATTQVGNLATDRTQSAVSQPKCSSDGMLHAGLARASCLGCVAGLHG